MNHLFVISSAINTKFGEFDSNQRLLQTYRTFKSVHDRVPNAKLAVFESSGYPLDSETVQALHNVVHCLVDMSKNKEVSRIHNSTPNWDIVKNACEIMCFNIGFSMLPDTGMLDGIDRIHKLSGRYLLTDDFDLSVYEKYPDKIIITEKYPTTFGERVDIPHQFVSRLWSWPIQHHSIIRKFYVEALEELKNRLDNGRYADIEHLMYLLLPKDLIQEVPLVGVEGLLGGNKHYVRD
jgi:hypothetical protein